MLAVVGFEWEGVGVVLRLREKGEERKREAKEEGWAAFCLRLKEMLRFISLCLTLLVMMLFAPSVQLPTVMQRVLLRQQLVPPNLEAILQAVILFRR